MEQLNKIPKESKIEYEKNWTKICLEFLWWVWNIEKWVSLTWSATLLTIELSNWKNYKWLIDFWMFQGCENAIKYNEVLPFDLDKIDFVLVTHTHVDHIWKLLHFSKNEFNWTIWTTKLNRNVLYRMLLDVIKLQEKEPKKTEIIEKKIKNYINLIDDIKQYWNDWVEQIEDIINSLEEELKKLNKQEELDYDKKYFEQEDLTKLFWKINSIDYYEKVEVANWVTLSFISAWHLPWSAQIILKIEDWSNETMNIWFSWDLWKIRNPAIWWTPDVSKEKLDLYMIESTYAWRNHPDFFQQENELIEVINKTIDKWWKIIFPLFMQWRAQEVIVYLYKLIENWKIKNIPVFYDWNNIENILKDYANSEDYKDIFERFLNNNFLRKAVTWKWKNKQLNFGKYKGSAILLTTWWMMDGWTIRKYLEYLQDSKNLFISMWYQAENTLWKSIFIEWEEQIETEKWKININAKLHNFRWFSGHADEDDLLKLLSQMNFNKDAKIIINHWEKWLSQTKFWLAIKDIVTKVKVLIAEFSDSYYNKYT